MKKKIHKKEGLSHQGLHKTMKLYSKSLFHNINFLLEQKNERKGKNGDVSGLSRRMKPGRKDSKKRWPLKTPYTAEIWSRWRSNLEYLTDLEPAMTPRSFLGRDLNNHRWASDERRQEEVRLIASE